MLTLAVELLLITAAVNPAPSITLVANGQPRATIVVAESATPAATLAALELQHHIKLITGATLPIKTDGESTEGIRILVGESTTTRQMSLRGTDFQPQEYLIRFLPDTIVLMGRDWEDTPENRAEQGRGTNWGTSLADWRHEIDYTASVERDGEPNRIELPGIFDDQATCYAVYDFLERFCGLRWYGPTELNVVHPSAPTLTVSGNDVRRAPAFRYREGIGGGWPIVNAQWNRPTGDQLNLYLRRLRVGGERWGGNHSFTGYQDRFLRKNPDHPDRFEGERPGFFAQGQTGGPGERQFCYTNAGLIAQVAQDARDFFDGKDLDPGQVAMGDYFAVVPLDNNRWCKCDACQAELAKDKENKRDKHFNSGTATHYLFGFVNAIAKEVGKTHPDKYIVSLAYHVYAFPPTEFDLEPNVAVAPCLQPRNYWAPKIKESERIFYKEWVSQDRPIYLWNYYCFPMEPAVIQKWHCFPGFSAHLLAEQIGMYHRDGVRGVFLCGIGEQVDYYLTMKLYDDPTQNVDGLLEEFFTGYFGAAAEPMARFHALIEETYTGSENYPEEVRIEDKQYHQNERVAWEFLGTEKRMKKLEALIEKAEKSATTELEKRRVATWKEGVWDYMVEGRAQYLAKKRK